MNIKSLSFGLETCIKLNQFYFCPIKDNFNIFQKNIQKNFNDLEQITWHDENILLEIEKY